MFFYIIKAILPLLIILGIILFIKSKRKPKTEQKPQKRQHEVIDTFDIEAQKATLAECEDLIAQDVQIRQETDLRQFQGRTDVTKEELATYMFEQRRWDGIYERHIQMEEIIKVCNLNSDDITWVENELKNYHPRADYPDFSIGNKCCFTRDTEEKAIWNYYNEQGRDRTYKYLNTIKREHEQKIAYLKSIGEYNEEFEKPFNERYKKAIQTGLDSLREYDYEAWLKMKGYTNG